MRFVKRRNGKLVLTSRITLVPGQHDRLIELINATPDGQLAPVMRELMRRGLDAAGGPDSEVKTVIREVLKGERVTDDDYHATFGGALRTYQRVP